MVITIINSKFVIRPQRCCRIGFVNVTNPPLIYSSTFINFLIYHKNITIRFISTTLIMPANPANHGDQLEYQSYYSYGAGEIRAPVKYAKAF